MSWKDRLANTEFTITTGDGKVYTPLWKAGETSIDFNVAFFDFINLPGTLVDRKQPRAQKYPLLFWFQGDDNIDQALAFRDSSKDKRAWQVQHPFYGNITGQPVSIGFNDGNYGNTEIVVDFWETITTGAPKSNISIPDATSLQFDELTVIAPVDYAGKVDLKPVDVSTAKTIANKIDALVGKAVNKINVANAVVSDPIYSDFNNYQTVRNAMFNGIDQLIAAPIPGMAAMYAMIGLPAQFELSVQIRLGLMQTLYGSAAGILVKSTPNNKAYFECVAAAAIGAMCFASVNPLAADYTTRADIAAVSDIIRATYAQYLQALDAAYTKLSNTKNAFSPSNQTQTQLQALVIQTLTNLNTLAFNAKQERVVTLEKDSNLILLAHKYIGLDALDVNLDNFRALNQIKNKELFLVKKGRKIKYLVG